MTKGNQKLLCEENLRHAEYYSMLSVFDDLYEKSKSVVVLGCCGNSQRAPGSTPAENLRSHHQP